MVVPFDPPLKGGDFDKIISPGLGLHMGMSEKETTNWTADVRPCFLPTKTYAILGVPTLFHNHSQTASGYQFGQFVTPKNPAILGLPTVFDHSRMAGGQKWGNPKAAYAQVNGKENKNTVPWQNNF